MTMKVEKFKDLLQERFGFSAFRQGQKEAIEALLEEKRVLCILPTGFGKSLLYQFPSLLLPGMTVVISPLLALMRDQINHLEHRFEVAAASINSDQDDIENAAVLERINKGEIKVLFAAPEQFDNPDRLQFLTGLPVSLVVVDEAHCISTWGHDFRPSYRNIMAYIHALQQKDADVRVLGLTATADRHTESDIAKQLGTAQRPLKVLRRSMDRPNIRLTVVPASGIEQKLDTCFQLLSQLQGSGIIYCATRENTELVAEFFQSRGLAVQAYHAGLPAEKKRSLQQAFVQDLCPAIAATNALGMGIDKPNLRYIIHFDFPGSITAYYQEVGRAGRDGRPAEGILLYDSADRRIQNYFIISSQPLEEDFTKVMEAVKKSENPPNIYAIKRETGLHPTKIVVVVAELIEQGFLKKASVNGRVCYFLNDSTQPLDLSRYKTQYRIKMRDLNQMIHYASQQKECCMTILRLALGDQKAERCGHCSVCRAPRFIAADDSRERAKVALWMADRVHSIAEMKSAKISAGVALLDASFRVPLVVDFLRGRGSSSAEAWGIAPKLLEMVLREIRKLDGPISAIVSIPSRTWGARESFVSWLGEQCRVPVYSHLLQWKSFPQDRQGELTNNDQRRYNVDKLMTHAERPFFSQGTVILLDDYIGSGATIREAARVLRKEIEVPERQPIVPFTLAKVKWKLGASGMV